MNGSNFQNNARQKKPFKNCPPRTHLKLIFLVWKTSKTLCHSRFLKPFKARKKFQARGASFVGEGGPHHLNFFMYKFPTTQGTRNFFFLCAIWCFQRFSLIAALGFSRRVHQRAQVSPFLIRHCFNCSQHLTFAFFHPLVCYFLQKNTDNSKMCTSKQPEILETRKN